MILLSVHPDTILAGQPSDVVLRLTNDGSGTYTGLGLSVRLPPQVLAVRGDTRVLIDRLDSHGRVDHPLRLKATAQGSYQLIVEGFSCRGPAGEIIQFPQGAVGLVVTAPAPSRPPAPPTRPVPRPTRRQEAVHYVDFQLWLSADQTIRASSAPLGEAQGTCHLDVAEMQAVQAAMDQGQDLSSNQLKRWGAMLYAALFPPPIHAHLRATLAAAEATGCNLRIHLVLEPPQMAALPWELLYDAGNNVFLANAPHTTLSRYLPVGVGLRDLQIDSPPLPVLLVLASPSDLPRLDLDVEERLVRQALARHIQAGLVTLNVLRNPTLRGLYQVLQETPYGVLHFSGHGEFRDDQGQVFLVTGDGTARAVDEESFGNLFLGNRRLGLVVLNACQSGATGSRRAFAGMAPHLVRRGIPAVVAMQFPIGDVSARIFAEEFYHALALGWPVDAAMQATRNAIALEAGLDCPDFATPILFLRAREGISLVADVAAGQHPGRIGQAVHRGDLPGDDEPQEVDQAMQYEEDAGDKSQHP